MAENEKSGRSIMNFFIILAFGLGLGWLYFRKKKPAPVPDGTSGTTDTSENEDRKMSQAEANKIADKIMALKGTTLSKTFPNELQKLVIALNEGFYRYEFPQGEPVTTKGGAVYEGKIVHQLINYRYSDGFINTVKKPIGLVLGGNRPKLQNKNLAIDNILIKDYSIKSI